MNTNRKYCLFHFLFLPSLKNKCSSSTEIFITQARGCVRSTKIEK